MKTWKIDQVHSEIKFKVKHLVVSTVTGKFDKFDASIETGNDDFTNSKITFNADVNSINTGNDSRDGHLKSADFFDAENYPMMRFESKSFTKISDDKYELIGNITIRGITKEIHLNVLFNGIAKSMDGNDIAGFEITGKLNRFEFGLHWNALTEAGGVTVGSDIKIEIFAEMRNVMTFEKAA